MGRGQTTSYIKDLKFLIVFHRIPVMGQGQSSFLRHFLRDNEADRCFVGLFNTGNTCYCNSVVQCLMNSHAVREYFRDFHSQFDGRLSKRHRRTTLWKFNRIIQHVLNTEKRLEYKTTCSDLLKYARKESGQFELGRQHDSHEFFVYLLDSFDKCIDSINKSCGEEVLSKFSSLFEGKKDITFECQECKTKQVIHDPFTFHYVGLEDIDEEHCDLQTEIDKSLRTEELKGRDRRMCDTCKAERDATLTVQFTELPRVFAVQLQRFHYDRVSGKLVKLQKHIQIPTSLTLYSTQSEEPVQYTLTSLIVHKGRGILKGHYLAMMHVGKSWILANDSVLSCAEPDFVDLFLAKEPPRRGKIVPYVVFYERDDTLVESRETTDKSTESSGSDT